MTPLTFRDSVQTIIDNCFKVIWQNARTESIVTVYEQESTRCSLVPYCFWPTCNCVVYSADGWAWDPMLDMSNESCSGSGSGSVSMHSCDSLPCTHLMQNQWLQVLQKSVNPGFPPPHMSPLQFDLLLFCLMTRQAGIAVAMNKAASSHIWKTHRCEQQRFNSGPVMLSVCLSAEDHM